MTQSPGRTPAQPDRSRLAQPLDDALAWVTAAKQDDRQHERGKQVHQAFERAPGTAAQDDGSEQQESGEEREPEDSLTCESAAIDSHRGARIPPLARGEAGTLAPRWR